MLNTMAQAKRDFEIGYLTKYSLEREPMGNGWRVHLGEGMAQGYLSDARTKQPRVFKSLDSAVNALEDIGFKVHYLSPN